MGNAATAVPLIDRSYSVPQQFLVMVLDQPTPAGVTPDRVLLGAGAHPKIVQERLGHQAISITMDTYSHVLPTLQRAAGDVFGELRRGAAP